MVKLHYWAVSENYIVIIVASAPILNALIKRAKEHYGDGTELSKAPSSRVITVKNSWTVDRAEAGAPADAVATPDGSDAEEKMVISTIP